MNQRDVAWTRGRGRVIKVRPEPVQVQANDGRPARFVWRGRLYTVLSVIERPGQRKAAAAVTGEADREPDDHDHDQEPAEWQCWLVTASPGRNVPASAFRICHDPVTDRWQLQRDGGSS